MSDKSQVIKEVVEHTGIFDFKSLYSFASRWFKDENYDVFEEKYQEKLAGNVREISIEWKCTKKLSDYFKYEIGVKWKISDLAEVEVEIEGKRKKSNKGKVNLEVKGTVIKDPDSQWDSGPLFRFLRDFYNKFVIPSRVMNTEEKLIGDVKSFKDEIKSFLELSGRK